MVFCSVIIMLFSVKKGIWLCVFLCFSRLQKYLDGRSPYRLNSASLSKVIRFALSYRRVSSSLLSSWASNSNWMLSPCISIWFSMNSILISNSASKSLVSLFLYFHIFCFQASHHLLTFQLIN